MMLTRLAGNAEDSRFLYTRREVEETLGDIGRGRSGDREVAVDLVETFFSKLDLR